MALASLHPLHLYGRCCLCGCSAAKKGCPQTLLSMVVLLPKLASIWKDQGCIMYLNSLVVKSSLALKSSCQGLHNGGLNKATVSNKLMCSWWQELAAAGRGIGGGMHM